MGGLNRKDPVLEPERTAPGAGIPWGVVSRGLVNLAAAVRTNSAQADRSLDTGGGAVEAGVPGQPLGAQAGICGDPGSPEYWNDLGAIAFVRGYASLAEDHFRKAIHTDSRYVPAYDNLVHLLMAQNRLVEAHGLRETYAELFPERAKGFLCAGHREERACELSVLIPAFNEAGKILSNIRQIRASLAETGRIFEIVVVDDGSEDDTYEIVELLSKTIREVRVYKSRTNRGKGSALREAALKARGTLVVFLDADLELHPRLVGEMLLRMERSGADVVLGSKRHPDSRVNYPLHRKVISTAYYLVNRLLFGLSVKDTQTGIKLFKKQVLAGIIPRLIEKKYAFDLELISNIHALGYTIEEAPITLDYSRKFGRIGLRAIMATAIDTLAVFYRLKIIKYYEKQPPPALVHHPKVSIVIPFASYGDYAHQSMTGCLALDYPDYEVILLPDEPLDVPDHPRLRVIPTGHVPPSEKRDIGVRESTGEIIAFLDDDAYPEPGWLTHAIRNFADKDVAAVGGPGITPEEDGFWRQMGGAVYASRLVSGNYRYRYVNMTYREVEDFPSCNLCVRKDAFRAGSGGSTPTTGPVRTRSCASRSCGI